MTSKFICGRMSIIKIPKGSELQDTDFPNQNWSFKNASQKRRCFNWQFSSYVNWANFSDPITFLMLSFKFYNQHTHTHTQKHQMMNSRAHHCRKLFVWFFTQSALLVCWVCCLSVHQCLVCQFKYMYCTSCSHSNFHQSAIFDCT